MIFEQAQLFETNVDILRNRFVVFTICILIRYNVQTTTRTNICVCKITIRLNFFLVWPVECSPSALWLRRSCLSFHHAD